ncbi:MAG: hypothetical protein N4A33_01945 [Bacteriovoracaceae bacterium]|jgi:D-lactate dehydrogenase|nr:hypothetical protein [Bacteriovoracaceae bacterium]
MKSNKKCSVALDVYEFEEDIFFHDFSQIGIEDDDLIRLLSFPNVLVTSHQAFFTNEALKNMAHTSLQNIACYLDGKSPNSSNIIV